MLADSEEKIFKSTVKIEPEEAEILSYKQHKHWI